ncbi:MAG: GNAT family N-acetyltransferase [Anaerolineae bacterium]|nr:GNAT family N-acetyltransferase [Anaerolineae bacterium]
MKNIFQGKLVRLRGVETQDADVFFQWGGDSDMARFTDYIRFPDSLEATRKHFERMATPDFGGDMFSFVIENGDGDVVGMINSHTCDRRVGSFMYGLCIAEPYRGRGYATEAILLLLRYFFTELRYQKVTVNVYSNNPASQALHKRLGFTPEGQVRRTIFTQGQYFDELFFGMTVEEFCKLYPDWVL